MDRVLKSRALRFGKSASFDGAESLGIKAMGRRLTGGALLLAVCVALVGVAQAAGSPASVANWRRSDAILGSDAITGSDRTKRRRGDAISGSDAIVGSDAILGSDAITGSDRTKR